VIQAKQNGFALKEIADIIKALTTSKSCSLLLAKIDKRLHEIAIQKSQLLKSEEFLIKLSSSCATADSGKNCDVINRF